MKTLDLFAGLGGVRLAFEDNGYKTTFANDIDKDTKTTHDLNFTNPKLHIQDLKTIHPSTLPEFDVLCGGFPCQPFSISGHRQGFDDIKERGDLFFYLVEILRQHKPKAFMLENVKHLVNHDNGRTFSIVKDALTNTLGYDIHYKVLNACNYGVPQNRERIFIVGFKDKTDFTFPEPIPLETRVRDLLEDEDGIGEEFYYRPDWKHYNIVRDAVTDPNGVYSWRWSYVRQNKKNLCPTITASNQTPTIVLTDKGIRRLTPRELLRVQGFPETFQLPDTLNEKKLHHQIGNSVCVPLVSGIARQIKRCLV